MTDGTVNAVNGAAICTGVNPGQGQNVTAEITGGTINGGEAIRVYGGSSVEVIGGTVNGELGVEGDLAITGGVFTDEDAAKYVDGEYALKDGKVYVGLSIPAEPAPIPETGDGMGLFVFAGLALISMLGMVVLKKREQF